MDVRGGFAATMAQLTDMSKRHSRTWRGVMRTPLQTWLEQRNMHPEAYDYIKVLAASQTAQAEPAMTPDRRFPRLHGDRRKDKDESGQWLRRDRR